MFIIRDVVRSIISVSKSMCSFFCVFDCVLLERPKCGGGQPPIMSASKTRALMAAVCLRGGLLHATVLQKQCQIYKTTIRKRGKNQSKCH